MKVVHIASEISPIAKVGGLADVVYGLCHACSEKGHEVCVIIPAYADLKKSFFTINKENFIEISEDFQFRYFKKKFKDFTVYGIDFLKPIFDREFIYGGPDEIKFFLYFSKAAAFLAQKLEPEIIHGHDWQASFALFELKRTKSPIKSLLTLHNLQYQGKLQSEELLKVGLNFPVASWMLDPHDHNLANLLKIGIESADRITTVSKSYHHEVLEGENAFGLDKILLIHRHKFLGILNGIDTEFFNPYKDKHIDHLFPKKAQTDFRALKSAKQHNLESLLTAHNKPCDERFTLCSVTRLADQKSPFLILYALKKVVDMGGRFILVGSLHGSLHDQEIIDFLKEYEDHPYVIAELNTNLSMAHKTYAASDALIVPSLFEPCGLTQMIAFRYGAVPLVRLTGGLKDTVFDVDTSDVIEDKRNGFTFDYPDTGGIDWVIDRAFKLYKDNQDSYYSLATKNLLIDHSWEKSSEAYLEVYEILCLNDHH